MIDQIERQLDLPAPPSEVWPYLLEEELLAQWLADEARFDLLPGGEASFRIGTEERSGWVEAVTAPDESDGCGELVFWWGVPGEPATRVEVTLSPTEDGGSSLRILETRPLERLDLVGLPLGPGHGAGGHGGGGTHGPALVAA